MAEMDEVLNKVKVIDDELEVEKFEELEPLIFGYVEVDEDEKSILRNYRNMGIIKAIGLKKNKIAGTR